MFKVLKLQGQKQWSVFNNDEFKGSYATNALAWKAVDRLMNEPVNKQEQTAMWLEGLNDG